MEVDNSLFVKENGPFTSTIVGETFPNDLSFSIFQVIFDPNYFVQRGPSCALSSGAPVLFPGGAEQLQLPTQRREPVQTSMGSDVCSKGTGWTNTHSLEQPTETSCQLGSGGMFYF